MTYSPAITAIAPDLARETAPGWAKPKLRLTRKHLLGAAGALALIGAAALTHDYVTVGRFLESTDDAYLAADSTTVAPKVSGYIKEVLVADNQVVKAGQVLAMIDDADYRTAVAQAEAERAGARADIAAITADLDRQDALIESARASLAMGRANSTFAEQDRARYAELVKTGYGSVQRAQSTDAAVRAANAEVSRDNASLAAVLRQKDTLRAQLAKAEAALARDQAMVDQAALNLGHTAIVAAIDGAVGARSARVGQYVQAGTQLMQVVPLHDVYVTANFKKTQLTHMHAGQSVSVTVDAYPGVVFAGHVDSLSPASGQEFALLPADNATGNFTKVVQRVPVKLVIAENAELAGRLRPGMSVEATVNTKTGR